MAQSYLIDEAQFARLQRVEIALHGDGTVSYTHLTLPTKA